MAKPPKSGRKAIGNFTFKPKGSKALELKPGSQAIAWDSIRPRPDVNTRDLDPRHLLSLARSIAAVGLIQPLAIDTSGKLIAGGHRLAVWSLLSIADPTERQAAFLKGLEDYTPEKADPEKGDAKLPEPEEMAKELAELDLDGWKQAHPDGQVPVLVFDEDAARTKNKALLREVAENEKRRSYTGKEVMLLAERLKKAGFDDLKGRPEEDQQSVRAELARILGKSSRQIRRYLNDPTVAAKPKGGHGVRLSKALNILNRIGDMSKALEKGLAKDTDAKPIIEAAGKLAKLVEAYLAGKAKPA